MKEMPEKLANSATQFPIVGASRNVVVMLTLSLVAFLSLWRIDQSTIADLLDGWNAPKTAVYANSTRNSSPTVISSPESENPVQADQNLTVSYALSLEMLSMKQKQQNETNSAGPNWVSVELEPNYSSKLMARWLEPGGAPCRETKTADVKVEAFDNGKIIDLPTGEAHEIVFRAVDESGAPRCLGGDYFEVDLSGERWKARPPLKDFGNGTYSFTLQVHPDFDGVYSLTIILLFRHFEGLKYSPTRFVVDKEVRRFSVKFHRSGAQLPDLPSCGKSDFDRDVWAGRWTRHARNDACAISNDGRFRCLELDYPCTKPWCNGSLGRLESNGWVYSAHCSFNLFNPEEAWRCLNNRWIFFWGDSNHVDTTRNILFFFLGVPNLEAVTRRFDEYFSNPKNESERVRITNIFNGHWDMKGNYLGLDSLASLEYQGLIKSYFNGSVVPDTIIFNSGLHDGVHWPNLRRFIAGADRAASFWGELMETVKSNGLEVPNFIFRSTVATGGYARSLAFNPSKMEAFNGVLLEKLRGKGVVSKVVDNFDMTWAWHFDNRCNDGVHYGRFPAKLVWRDGKIGHQYFVDLMLGQVLLNVICAR